LEEKHIFGNLPIDDHSDMTESDEEIDGKPAGVNILDRVVYLNYCFNNYIAAY
jgi:hypothetical protein